MRAILVLLLLAITLRAHAASPAAFDARVRRFDSQGIANADIDAELQRLRALLPPGDAHRARVYDGVVCDWNLHVPPEAGIAHARRGLAAARAADDPAAAARYAYCLGDWLIWASDPKAEAAFGEGIELARRAESVEAMAWGHVARARYRSLHGRHAQALEDVLEAQRLFERTGDAALAQLNLVNIGIVYRRLGDYSQAIQYLRRGEAFARRTGRAGALDVAVMQLGWAYQELQRPQQAMALFEESLRRAGPQPIARVSALEGMTDVWLDLHDGRRALDTIERSRQGLPANGVPDPMYDVRRGEALALLGRHRDALAAFDRAEHALRGDGSLRYLLRLLRARAQSHRALGDMAAALADFAEADRLRDRMQADAGAQAAQLARVRFDAAQRDLEARRIAREAALRQRELHALERGRRWRDAALALAAALILALVGAASALARYARRLKRATLTDPLTGVGNRRASIAAAEAMLARVPNTPVSAIFLDIDHFKRINDTRGHAAGDGVLRAVAATMQRLLPRGARLGRIGGEEFLVLAPGLRLHDALACAGELRAAIAAVDAGDAVPGLRVSASAGVAEARVGENVDAWLARADAALYRAKSAGRNRVEPALD